MNYPDELGPPVTPPVPSWVLEPIPDGLGDAPQDGYDPACDIDRWEGLDDAEWRIPSDEQYEHSLTELSRYVIEGRRLVAYQYRLLADVLRDAAADPVPWCGPDPTLDPGWVDPRERTPGQVRADRSRWAVRAATADAAVRLRVSEQTVSAKAGYAELLRERCPRVWQGFVDGAIPERNAITTAQLAATLPADTSDAWERFDTACADAGRRLTPGKFRTRARVLRERIHPEPLDARHSRAKVDRGVWVDPAEDGMSTLTAILAAADADTIMRRLDATAGHLAAQDGETRTRAHIRADTFTDLLVRDRPDTEAAPVDGVPSAPIGHVCPVNRPTVAVTIPALTLLGRSDEPPMLEGYGPIPIDTARQFAGNVPVWTRVLTHPVTGTILEADTYRAPAALRRLITARTPHCVFPGCTRPARDCELDHRVEWARGGSTSSDNLDPKCQHHHGIRHHTRWRFDVDPDTGELTWTSPTGNVTGTDPPPF